MKTLSKFIITIVATLALAGCKNMTPQQQAITQDAAQVGVTSAAMAATALVVRNNPQSVPDFQAGQVVLNQLAGSGMGLSTNNIQAILAQENVTNPAVATVISAAVLTVTPFLDSITNVVEQQQILHESFTWASTGIVFGIPLGQALASSKQP